MLMIVSRKLCTSCDSLGTYPRLDTSVLHEPMMPASGVVQTSTDVILVAFNHELQALNW